MNCVFGFTVSRGAWGGGLVGTVSHYWLVINYICVILQFRNNQCVHSRDSLSHNDCCHPGPACLFGIQRCLLVESKDGRHHYAAHSSTAKIRAGRLADSSERKSKKPKRPQPQFSLLNLTLTYCCCSPPHVTGWFSSCRHQ